MGSRLILRAFWFVLSFGRSSSGIMAPIETRRNVKPGLPGSYVSNCLFQTAGPKKLYLSRASPALAARQDVFLGTAKQLRELSYTQRIIGRSDDPEEHHKKTLRILRLHRVSRRVCDRHSRHNRLAVLTNSKGVFSGWIKR